jgi:hypothetical protein
MLFNDALPGIEIAHSQGQGEVLTFNVSITLLITFNVNLSFLHSPMELFSNIRRACLLR